MTTSALFYVEYFAQRCVRWPDPFDVFLSPFLGAESTPRKGRAARGKLAEWRGAHWLNPHRRGGERTYSSVHHVRRSDPVDAGFGVGKAILQDGDGLIIDDFAVDYEAVVAVVGVGVQCDIGLHAELGHFCLNGDGPLNKAVGIMKRWLIVFFAE